ncbi:hypothetical protein SAMN05444392_101884 [Seinonella peptonophila]|uniref:Lmo0937 family membrane protein n=1 Tax=Seinonella peptonophila TaxID=112248 RepID=A0A1M4U9M7_9BACL|nr:DUF5670 family protein [Seinonella peptonophila]SHE53358.1 hypothetical protein SAMN05444392_101884 [Seinonella peptonophila]
MLWSIICFLIVVWLVLFLTKNLFKGLVHLLLGAAAILLIIKLFQFI